MHVKETIECIAAAAVLFMYLKRRRSRKSNPSA